MTKFQKQMLTIAAAGALTAVTALPAMAFENEFHGTFGVKTFLSNIDGNASGIAAIRNEKTNTNNYTEQRTRLQYIAKASDDLKLVTHFEMDTVWGKTETYGTANNGGGGGIDTDAINIKTKWAYLDFNLGKSVNVKAGQQAYKDTLKGLYVDADLPMAYVTTKLGAYTLGLGYSRFNDNDLNIVGGADYKGDYSADLYAIDNTYAFNKDTKVTLSYYLNSDNYDNAVSATTPYRGSRKINTLALGGQTKIGALDLSGFAAMQAGYEHKELPVPLAGKVHYHGWAADVLAKMKLGNGTARTGFLFTSGNNSDNAGSNHGWQTLSYDSNSAAQNSYTESGMMLLVRNPSMGGSPTDNYLRKPITNIALLHMGYDASITEKLYANGNVGFAWLPASDALYGGARTTTTHNGGDFLGTELNAEVGYKMYANLTLKAQAAYVVLGSAFKDTATTGDNPANPYTFRVGAMYSF